MARVFDNAKSFVRAATDIKKFSSSIRDKGVQDLQFHYPRAPWRGFSFERVVGLTKNALAKTLGGSLVSNEEFRTIMAELASTISDRPLSLKCRRQSFHSNTGALPARR